MTLDPNRWTLRTQQAVECRRGRRGRTTRGQAEVTPEHLLAGDPRPTRGCGRPTSCPRAGVDTRALLSKGRQEHRQASRRLTGRTSPPFAGARDLLEAADALRSDMGDEYLSVEHLLLSMSDLIGSEPRQAARATMREVPAKPSRDLAEPRGPSPSLSSATGRDLARARGQGKARPGHRPGTRRSDG